VRTEPVDEVDRPAWFTLMAPAWWPPPGSVTQAYGLCFDPSGRVVLVQLDDGFWTLPGGQVEPGETPLDTLVREVAEEVCARVVRARYLACQHVWDPQAPDGPPGHYQARFWTRVEVDPWRPRHETVARSLVTPAQVHRRRVVTKEPMPTLAGAQDEARTFNRRSARRLVLHVAHAWGRADRAHDHER
jgi:8-oxo-dGTP pyrophosphatase MutT (NUDIX family)